MVDLLDVGQRDVDDAYVAGTRTVEPQDVAQRAAGRQQRAAAV